MVYVKSNRIQKKIHITISPQNESPRVNHQKVDLPQISVLKYQIPSNKLIKSMWNMKIFTPKQWAKSHVTKNYITNQVIWKKY